MAAWSSKTPATAVAKVAPFSVQCISRRLSVPNSGARALRVQNTRAWSRMVVTPLPRAARLATQFPMCLLVGDKAIRIVHAHNMARRHKTICPPARVIHLVELNTANISLPIAECRVEQGPVGPPGCGRMKIGPCIVHVFAHRKRRPGCPPLNPGKQSRADCQQDNCRAEYLWIVRPHVHRRFNTKEQATLLP